MKIVKPRSDFIIVEDFFTAEQAAQWLEWFTQKGKDPVRGFHHPFVKANRFHKNPKYPVKKFMCLGLYWNPQDYIYYHSLPDIDAKPFPLPPKLIQLCQDILQEFFPWKNYSPQAALVNFYTDDSSMGLHVDKDEEEKSAPVIGLNFGSTCRFFYEDEQGQMKDLRIPGNSIYVFGASARQMRHGLGSIYAKTLSPGSEAYLANKERLNITIRQVYK